MAILFILGTYSLCEGIERQKMSISAVKSSDVAFEGKKSKNVENENKSSKEKHKIINTITKPVKDSFHKSYGEDAKPSASLVADFAADKILKFGMLTLGSVVLFAKMKNSTNGMTQAVKKAMKDKSGGVAKKISSVMREIKNNNATFITSANESLEAAKEAGGVTSFVKKTAKNIFKPKETFNTNGKLGKAISRVFGDKSEKVMGALRKVGVSGGSDLLDTAIATGATVVVGTGLNNVTDEVTKSDNKDLAVKNKLANIAESVETVGKLANAVDFVSGF